MEDLSQEIERVAAELQKPAGPSPDFADRDAISKNRAAFVASVHKTWKRLHDDAIHRIFFWDAFSRREVEHPTTPLVAEFGDYNRQVWRKINDAIVWSIFGMQRHAVKRLCLYRRRTYSTKTTLPPP